MPFAIGYGDRLSYRYVIGDDNPTTTSDNQIPLDRLDYGENFILIQLVDRHTQTIAEKEVVVHLARQWYQEPWLQAIAFLCFFGILYTGQARALVEKTRQYVMSKLRALARWLILFLISLPSSAALLFSPLTVNIGS